MAGSISRRQFLSELEKLEEMDEETLSGSEGLSDLPIWDSIIKLAVIAMVEQKTGLILDGQALSQAASIADLFKMLGDRLLD